MNLPPEMPLTAENDKKCFFGKKRGQLQALQTPISQPAGQIKSCQSHGEVKKLCLSCRYYDPTTKNASRSQKHAKPCYFAQKRLILRRKTGKSQATDPEIENGQKI